MYLDAPYIYTGASRYIIQGSTAGVEGVAYQGGAGGEKSASTIGTIVYAGMLQLTGERASERASERFALIRDTPSIPAVNRRILQLQGCVGTGNARDPPSSIATNVQYIYCVCMAILYIWGARDTASACGCLAITQPDLLPAGRRRPHA